MVYLNCLMLMLVLFTPKLLHHNLVDQHLPLTKLTKKQTIKFSMKPLEYKALMSIRDKLLTYFILSNPYQDCKTNLIIYLCPISGI